MGSWRGGKASATTAASCACAFQQDAAFPAEHSLSTLSLIMMELRYTRSCVLYPRTCQCFTEGFKHPSSPLPTLAVLGGAEHQQCQEKPQGAVGAGICLMKPLGWMHPMPEATLWGGWWIKCLAWGQHSKSAAEDDDSHSCIFFFSPSAHNTQWLEGDGSCRMRPCSVISLAQLWSAPAWLCVPASPLHNRNEAKDELTPSWWQFNSPHGFQGGGWGVKQQFLNLSSNSSAKARQTCSPIWGTRNCMPLKSSQVAKLMPIPTYRNNYPPSNWKRDITWSNF